jgi:hypothetical protein
VSPLHPTTPLPVTGLATLAEVVERRLAVEDPAGPTLLRARSLGDEVELGWLPLPAGRHPVDELLGTTAPADWCAVGVASPGRATVLDGRGPTSVAVHTVHLVGRDGAWASRWGPLGEAEGVAGDAGDPRRPTGRIDDVCRRALGLPTGDPPAPTSLLWALQWLDAVVDVAVRTRSSPVTSQWFAVAALHPAVAALQADRFEIPATPAALAELDHQLTTWRDWPVLRRSCAAGTWDERLVEPDIAGWLDDGAFARWALGAFPELDDLRAAVADLLPRSVVDDVEATLAATEVVR